MSDNDSVTGPLYATGEFDAHSDDPEVTYTLSNVNRIDGKKFVRFQVGLANEPDHGWYVDIDPEGARWIGHQMLAKADLLDPEGKAS